MLLIIDYYNDNNNNNWFLGFCIEFNVVGGII